MPLPVRFNPSYSSTGVNRKSILCSATPQQKFSNNFGTLSCNSKYAAMSERKHVPDTRPLADSAYHQSCVNQILNFCSKNNYAIKRETLNFMSTSEMEKLFSFILSFYEIKIKQNCLDIEIPKVMETLCYPYHINKTSLRSYATPKSKGVVLSMIIFLIEPLMMERKSIFVDQRDDCNLEHLKLILNRNQEEKDNYIKNKMNKQLVKKNELESLIKRTDELKIEAHGLDNQEDQLNKLRETNLFFENQLKEFKSYEKKMEEYVELISKENNELKKKIEFTEQEIENLNEHKLSLENKVKEQAHSVDEMNYYIQRDKQVQIEIHKLTEELKKARQEYFQEKLKQDELFDMLKELFFKLTNIIRTFKTDLPNAQHLNEALNNERFENLIEFLNNQDFENDSKFNLDLYAEFLKLLKQAVNNDLLFCKEEICKSQEELQSSLNRIEQLETKNRLIVQQNENMIQKLEQKKLDLINQVKNKKNENDQVKAEINVIETDVKLKRKKAMNENLECKNKLEETKKEFYDYWMSIKNKVINLESQLNSILPIYKEFLKEKEQAKLLNFKLSKHLKEERNAIEKLMDNVIIK